MSDQPTQDAPERKGFLRSVGPAIIVASVVLGPGSILTSSKVGCQFGYDLMWLLVTAGILMFGMVALSARLGVVYQRTLCEELAHRLGRPVAVFVGTTMFVVIGIFQVSNNMAVLASARSLFGIDEKNVFASAFVFLAMNGFIIVAMFGLRSLYHALEVLMKFLVGVMVIGFAVNLFYASPSLSGIMKGILPLNIPSEFTQNILLSSKNDPIGAVQGMLATTFSVAGAMYQAYLVKAKGWTTANLRQGRIDSGVGTFVLIGISLMVMVTAAAVLHGVKAPSELKSVIDVSKALQPLFGRWAAVLFSLGLFAGAFSSFLVNAMIGGTLFSDGFGLGGSVDGKHPKQMTVLVLILSMVIAFYLTMSGAPIVPLIIFAQALAVVGFPVLAIAIIYLSTRAEANVVDKLPVWMLALGCAGAATSVLLGIRTAWKFYLTATT